VVLHQGRVLLIRRGKAPLRGRWVIPGGTVELGETLVEALVREVGEETGLTVRPMEVLNVFDHIDRDGGGGVLRHFVIVDYLCAYVCGEVCAGSDAEAAVFATPGELAGYDLPEKALEVVEDAFGREAGTAEARGRVARFRT
jgi:ADP-ribose pyrophosphatase